MAQVDNSFVIVSKEGYMMIVEFDLWRFRYCHKGFCFNAIAALSHPIHPILQGGMDRLPSLLPRQQQLLRGQVLVAVAVVGVIRVEELVIQNVIPEASSDEVGVVNGSRDRYGSSRPGKQVTERERHGLQIIEGHSHVVDQYRVVGGTRRAEKTGMREQVKVVPPRIDDLGVHHGAAAAVSGFSVARLSALWEHAEMVFLANGYESDPVMTIGNVTLCETSFNRLVLHVNDFLELAFCDAVSVHQDLLRWPYVRVLEDVNMVRPVFV